MPFLSAVPWLTAPLFLFACSGSPKPTPASTPARGLRLVPARTVTLKETDSLFIGSPSAVWLGKEGSFFVADRLHPKIAQVDSTGAFVRILSRPGPGPGELEAPIQIVGLGDSAIGVADEVKRVVEIFSLPAGKFSRARPYDGSVTSAWVDGSIIWMGGVSPRHGRGVKRWDLGADSIDHLVSLPLSYQRNGPLAAFFYNVAVAPQGDNLIVGYSADRAILVTDRHGTVVDSFAVPSAGRRGEPADLEQRIDPKNDMEFADLVALSSVLVQIGARADGSLLFVHLDYGMIPPRTITAKAFVSLVSADLTRACVDAEVPQDDPGVMPFAFRGDTLFTVKQLAGAGRRVETSLVGYTVDSSNCDWLPVAHTKLH